VGLLVPISRFRGGILRCVAGEKIVLPRSLLDEARRLSEDHLNISKAFEKVQNIFIHNKKL
jgi:hypothetical protein